MYARRLVLAFVFALALCSTAPLHAAPIAYDEAVHGDLPDNDPELGGFTPFTLDVGSNTVSGSTSEVLGPFLDPDAFSFIVPAGMEVTSAAVSLSRIGGALNFPPNVIEQQWDLYKGNPVFVFPNFPTVIESVGQAPLDTVSNVPLPADTYHFRDMTIWLDFGQSPYTFTLTVAAAVPEPASLALLGLGSLALLARRRTRKG